MKIFVASGSDLSIEREKIILILDLLNNSFPHLDVKAIYWEIDTPPGSYDGKRIRDEIDPLLEQSDIVLVLFYSKVGKFTLNELRLALQKKKKVFLYFKSGFSPKTKTEYTQYGEILGFKEEVEKESKMLYREYDTVDRFRELLEDDLNLHFSQAYTNLEKEGQWPGNGLKPHEIQNGKVYRKNLRIFESSATVIPGKAYYVRIENVTNTHRQDIMEMIDQGRYFSIFAPRQSGKTTFLWDTCRLLHNNTSSIAAILNFESYQSLDKKAFYSDIERKLYPQIIERLKEIKCNRCQDVHDFLNDYHLENHLSFQELFIQLNKIIPSKKMVFFIDEFDGIPREELKNFLTSLRSLYLQYKDSTNKILYSVGLIGIRDITQLVVGGVSPFNIADQVDLPPFSLKNVQDLYSQYTEETNQPLTLKAVQKIHAETAGQPWLVNRLGTILTTIIKPGTVDAIDENDVEKAIRLLLLEKNVHFDNLYEKAKLYKEAFIEIVFDNVQYKPNNEEQRWLEQYGLVKKKETKAVVANNIYKRRFTDIFFDEAGINESMQPQAFLLPGNRLDMEKSIKSFSEYIARIGVKAFYRKGKPYEKTGQFLLTAWLHPFLKDGQGDLRYEIPSGLGRMDIILNYKGIKYIIETKINRFNLEDTINDGVEQLVNQYLASELQDEGFLVVFDAKKPVNGLSTPRVHRLNNKKVTVFIINIGKNVKSKRKK